MRFENREGIIVKFDQPRPRRPVKRVRTGVDELFGTDTLTIPAAAAALGLSARTIRMAIRSGKLKAFVIGGRAPLRSGAGMGYRMNVRDLQAWYFGADTLPKEEGDTKDVGK